jgi:nucleotide-binding universal stress UspA family protein
MSTFAPKSILAPIDLGPVSRKSLEWAGLLARTFGASVEVFHADWVEAPPYFTSGQVAELAAQQASHRHALEQMISDVARPALGAETSWTIQVGEGPAIREIDERIAQTAPDLVVLGSHGRSGAARLLLGSVAENIIRHSTQPVLIVPQRFSADRPAKVRTVLCPVNFTETARRCLGASADLAAGFGANLHALHALEDHGEAPDAAQRRLCAWLPDNVRTRCAVSEIVRHGDPAEQILHVAKELDADLIALAAEHRPFLEWTTIGTTTIRVMRHSEIPVLMLPVRS